MARYIDADKLKEMIEAKADTLIEGKEAFLYVSKWLDLLPSIDVVPKSEVKKIFKEILNIIRGYSHSALVAKNNYGATQAEYIGIDILKLKKKYTEEKK